MDGIARYIMQIVSTGILCYICQQIANTTKSAAMIRFMGALALLYAILAPIIGGEITGQMLPVEEYFTMAEDIAQQGQEAAEEAISASIKQQTEAYILDKAAQLGTDLEVRVELSLDSLPKPIAVQIKGNVSPYAKYTLSTMIVRDLDIAKEHQKWID